MTLTQISIGRIIRLNLKVIQQVRFRKSSFLKVSQYNIDKLIEFMKLDKIQTK